MHLFANKIFIQLLNYASVLMTLAVIIVLLID